jgi:hypothetical protein
VPTARAAEKKAGKAEVKDRKSTQILDNFMKVDWSTAKDNSSEVKVSQVAGPGGSALRISYDLKNGKWIAISKGFAIDDFKGKGISFQMKSKGRQQQPRGEIGGRGWDQLRRQTAGFDRSLRIGRPISLSEADFSYWWGGDPALGSIKAIYFAVSAGDGGAGEILWWPTFKWGKPPKRGISAKAA